MTSTDESLMQAVKQGETECFGVLFKRYHDRLFSFFYRMTGEGAASEDLAQEVFVRMLKYRSSFSEKSQFRPWMYQIARNVRSDHFRRRQTELRLVEEKPATPHSGANRFETEQQLDLLHRALLALSEDKREILVLARFEEMKYEAIAALLQVETGTVKVRVHRALRELRAAFLKMSGEEIQCDVKTSKTILRST
jgi:RNA polymerase sigma factor (sigma-70 family)